MMLQSGLVKMATREINAMGLLVEKDKSGLILPRLQH
jgi:hypothetical protein